MASESRMVKYCPLCHAENPPRQPFCVKCRDCDLSNVPVEPVRSCGASAASPLAAADAPHKEDGTRRVEQPQLAAPDTCVLILMRDPTIQFSVRSGDCVGRTDASDVVLRNVPDLDAISSRHARFLHRNGQWYVQHIGGTNFIKVDGSLYHGDEEVALYDGATLVLSLTAFHVRLGGTPA